MQNNLNILEKWKTTLIFWQMEDDLNILANGRQPQYFGKWKTTTIFGNWKTTAIFCQMEDDLNILEIGRRPP
jgi:hypothetical protein